MSRAPHRFRPALSLRGHPLDVIDHNELDGPFSRLQSESEPILNYLLHISERDTRETRAATHTRRMLPFRRSPFSVSGRSRRLCPLSESVRFRSFGTLQGQCWSRAEDLVDLRGG